MAVSVLVNGITYNIPTTGEELWGTEVTDWIVAVSSELASIVSDGDLGPTVLVTLANNQASPVNVPSLAFDPATIRSAEIQYYCYRTWNSGSQEVVESGRIYLHYKDIANTWDLAQVGNDVTASGITFSITTAGQVQYTSSNLTPSVGYTGAMKYRATVLRKT